MAQRGMWHLVELIMRDLRRGETKGSDNMVRKCEAMAEEE